MEFRGAKCLSKGLCGSKRQRTVDPHLLTDVCCSYGWPVVGLFLIIYLVLTLSSSTYSFSYKSVSYNNFSSNKVVMWKRSLEGLVLEFPYCLALLMGSWTWPSYTSVKNMDFKTNLKSPHSCFWQLCFLSICLWPGLCRLFLP